MRQVLGCQVSRGVGIPAILSSRDHASDLMSDVWRCLRCCGGCGLPGRTWTRSRARGSCPLCARLRRAVPRLSPLGQVRCAPACPGERTGSSARLRFRAPGASPCPGRETTRGRRGAAEGGRGGVPNTRSPSQRGGAPAAARGAARPGLCWAGRGGGAPGAAG